MAAVTLALHLHSMVANVGIAHRDAAGKVEVAGAWAAIAAGPGSLPADARHRCHKLSL